MNLKPPGVRQKRRANLAGVKPRRGAFCLGKTSVTQGMRGETWSSWQRETSRMTDMIKMGGK